MYLDENIPLQRQLSERYGVPIPLHDYKRYGLAEFVVFSEIERAIEKSTFANKGIVLSMDGGRIKLDGDFNVQKEGPAIKLLIQNSMRALGMQI